MVEKAWIEDVMKVLIASRKQDMHQLWTTCSHLVAKSGLPPEVLAKHLPIEVVAKIEELRLKSSFSRRSSSSFLGHHHHHHHHQLDVGPSSADIDDHHKIRRMRRALDSSDVELVKLMVTGEELNLDDALALHYAVENCSREVVKALLELGAADVNYPAGPAGKTPLHVAAEMVCPDMVAVLLDHHADPNVQTVDGVTPLDILRTLTSDFLFKGAVPGLSHIEPNKLRLYLKLVQSAVMAMWREETNSTLVNGGGSGSVSSPHLGGMIYPQESMQKTGEYTNATKEKAGKAKDATMQKTSEYTDATKEKAGEAKDATMPKTGEYTEAAKEKARETKDVSVEKAREVTDASKGKLEKYKDLAMDAAKKVMDYLMGKKEETKKKIAETRESTKERMRKIEESVRERVEEARRQAEMKEERWRAEEEGARPRAKESEEAEK